MSENTTPASPRTQPRPRRRRRKTVSKFWLGLGLFAAVLALFWLFVMGYVHRCLTTYEAAQPERVVEGVVDRLRAGDLGSLELTYSRFENAESCRSAYAQALAGKTLTFRKSSASYDALAPIYEVYAQETPVAAVSLRESASRSLMFILTLQEWEVESVEPLLGGREPILITAPEGYTVRVNGVELDDRERTGNLLEIEELRYAANYVAVPKLVEYKVEGLLAEPTVEVLDPQGRVARGLVREGSSYSLDKPAPSDMDSQLEAYVLKNAKDYSNFFSRDLPGCQASVAPLRHMFPADSYYLELAENYRLHDMWMYSGHGAPSFSDERVSNYISYSENLFSCEVYFDKKMILTRTGEERHDITHTRYYYVNQGSGWVIADMQQILED